jgi:hypothetical protein
MGLSLDMQRTPPMAFPASPLLLLRVSPVCFGGKIFSLTEDFHPACGYNSPNDVRAVSDGTATAVAGRDACGVSAGRAADGQDDAGKATLGGGRVARLCEFRRPARAHGGAARPRRLRAQFANRNRPRRGAACARSDARPQDTHRRVARGGHVFAYRLRQPAGERAGHRRDSGADGRAAVAAPRAGGDSGQRSQLGCASVRRTAHQRTLSRRGGLDGATHARGLPRRGCARRPQLPAPSGCAATPTR